MSNLMPQLARPIHVNLALEMHVFLTRGLPVRSRATFKMQVWVEQWETNYGLLFWRGEGDWPDVDCDQQRTAKDEITV